MDLIYLSCSLIILAIFLFLFLKKKTASEQSLQEINLLKLGNEQLKISPAKHEERSRNLQFEKENIMGILQAEQERLLSELNTEREKTAQANQSLESIRSYYKAQ